MNPETQQQKLRLLNNNSNVAIFFEIQALNDSIKSLIKATEDSKTEVVAVANITDAQTDLAPLQVNFEALKTSIEGVTKAIQALPEDKEVDLKNVEKLLKEIAIKKMPEMDMTHMQEMCTVLDDISATLTTLKEKADEPISITLKIV